MMINCLLQNKWSIKRMTNTDNVQWTVLFGKVMMMIKPLLSQIGVDQENDQDSNVQLMQYAITRLEQIGVDQVNDQYR